VGELGAVVLTGCAGALQDDRGVIVSAQHGLRTTGEAGSQRPNSMPADGNGLSTCRTGRNLGCVRNPV